MYEYMCAKLERTGNKCLLYFEGRKISVNEFLAEVDKTAAYLKSRNIGAGDVVSINLPNLVNAVVALYAINKRGAIANMIHPLLPIEPVIKILDKVKSKLIFTFDGYYADNAAEFKARQDITAVISRASDYLPMHKKIFYRIKEPKITKCSNVDMYADFKQSNTNETLRGDIAVYLHSGGTTGKSKTVVLSAEAFNEIADALAHVPQDILHYKHSSIMVLPLFHGFGLGVATHAILSYGFTTAVMPRFNAIKFARTVKRLNIDICSGVPMMYEKLYRLKDRDFNRLRSLRYMFCGGDKLSYSLKKRVDNRMSAFGKNAEILEGYGLTETVTVCAVNTFNDYDDKSMGYPLRGIKIGILSGNGLWAECGAPGEICISGKTVMIGYLDGDDNCFMHKDGVKWVKTGDIGFIDEKGKLYFIERLKRSFKISGVNVYPSEIERIASEICGVKECYATKDKTNGKEIVIMYLAIEPAADAESIKKEITDACAASLIKYSVPKEYIIVKKLPRTPVGKIDSGKLENGK